MHSRILMALLFSTQLSFSQQTISQKQKQRLFEASKLWGNIKYLHPWLQYKSIPWDSAFAAISPAILSTQTTGQYFEQLQKLVSVLGDGATTVSMNKSKFNYINTQQGDFTIKDSVCTVRINSKKMADNYSEIWVLFRKISESLYRCKAIVLNLRITEPGSQFQDPESINLDFDYSNLTLSLFNGSITLPGERAILWNGFRSERQPNVGYNNCFTSTPITKINGKRKSPLKIVFLINENISLPQVAVALQKSGLAGIITEGNSLDKQTGSALNYYIDDSIMITMRKTEPVDENGLLSLKPNLQLQEHSDYNINLEKAINCVKNDLFSPYDANIKGSYTGLWHADEYSSSFYPSLGYRLLAAAKMYNIINFFNPDKDLMDNNWDSVYFKYLPRYINAKDSIDYAQAVTSMYANIQDSHGFIYGEVSYNTIAPLVGYGSVPPFRANIIENKIIITSILNDSIARKEGFEKGDIILKTGNKNSSDLVEQLREFYPASNKEAQNRNIVSTSFLGDQNKSTPITIQKKNGQIKNVNVLHNDTLFEIKYFQHFNKDPFKKDLPVCKIFSGNVGYIDMFQLTIDNVDSVMNILRYTKGIIFDDRSYPSSATALLFNYLPQRNAKGKAGLQGLMLDADMIKYGDGSMKKTTTYMHTEVVKEVERKWLYNGKLVLLINEYTQSAAEGLASHLLQAGAIGVGSHTAGANGDITNFNLPGMCNLSFSGRKPFNADGTTMQRVGIIPKIKISPTINGFRNGKDEILERGIKYVLKGK